MLNVIRFPSHSVVASLVLLSTLAACSSIDGVVSGDKVVDHEHITGLQPGVLEAIAVYEVVQGRIRTVWFH